MTLVALIGLVDQRDRVLLQERDERAPVHPDLDLTDATRALLPAVLTHP